jgi:hypothetical protein
MRAVIWILILVFVTGIALVVGTRHIRTRHQTTLREADWEARVADDPNLRTSVYDILPSQELLLVIERPDLKDVYGYHIDLEGRRIGLAIVLDFRREVRGRAIVLHDVVRQGCKSLNRFTADFEKAGTCYRVIAHGMEVPEYEDRAKSVLYVPAGLKLVMNKRIDLCRKTNGGSGSAEETQPRK